jgi:hypothetical protein
MDGGTGGTVVRAVAVPVPVAVPGKRRTLFPFSSSSTSLVWWGRSGRRRSVEGELLVEGLGDWAMGDGQLGLSREKIGTRDAFSARLAVLTVEATVAGAGGVWRQSVE